MHLQEYTQPWCLYIYLWDKCSVSFIITHSNLNTQRPMKSSSYKNPEKNEIICFSLNLKVIATYFGSVITQCILWPFIAFWENIPRSLVVGSGKTGAALLDLGFLHWGRFWSQDCETAKDAWLLAQPVKPQGWDSDNRSCLPQVHSGSVFLSIKTAAEGLGRRLSQ